jgi:spore germination cell wall hydrolase CwlJ-like protein
MKKYMIMILVLLAVSVSADNFKYLKEGQSRLDLSKNILAQTIYFEGDRQSVSSLKAVATVIQNRVKKKIAQGKAIQLDSLLYAKACLTPYQFSHWNKWIHAQGTIYPPIRQRSGTGWTIASNYAEQILNNSFEPEEQLENCTHFYTNGSPRPEWAEGKEEVIIGGNVFVLGDIDFPSFRN